MVCTVRVLRNFHTGIESVHIPWLARLQEYTSIQLYAENGTFRLRTPTIGNRVVELSPPFSI